MTSRAMVSDCVEINQCVDGVEDDATIHPGKLAPALSLATSKRVHWFPKLTCAVGDRAWAYDGRKAVHKSNVAPCNYGRLTRYLS